jgi:hypothetical protein
MLTVGTRVVRAENGDRSPAVTPGRTFGTVTAITPTGVLVNWDIHPAGATYGYRHDDDRLDLM